MSKLIRPGVHSNLMISPKTAWDERGSFNLVICASQSENAELSAFESNAISIGMESTLKFYSPNMTDYDKNKKTSADIGEELRVVRFQFMEYGKIYAPKDSVESYIGGVKMFEGLGVAPADYGRAVAQLINEDWAKKVFKNLCDKFHQFLTAANAFTGQILFRQKFLRQSKDKNWAVIPNSDISLWIEPMTVALADSKVKFTEWEIKNGKNDPNPAAASKSQNTTPADLNAGKNLFGGAPTTAPPIMTPPPIVPAVAQTNIQAPVISNAAVPPVAQPVAPIIPTAAPVAPVVPAAIMPPVVPAIPPVVPVMPPVTTVMPPVLPNP